MRWIRRSGTIEYSERSAVLSKSFQAKLIERGLLFELKMPGFRAFQSNEGLTQLTQYTSGHCVTQPRCEPRNASFEVNLG
jgi:hypothetical protein